MKLIVAEYFAGIGLVRMGLEACGWKVAYANDFAEKKHEMYKAFFPDDQHYIVEDVFKIDTSSIPYTTLATCSFPCIDLSLAGNMNGIVNGKHSSAFWGFINVLKAQGELASPIVMVENVPGWLHSNNGADFRITVQALNDLGYSCDVFTMDALRFTPQSRLRVFLVGTKAKIGTDPMSILSRSKALLPDILRESILSNIDLKWCYNEVPEPPPLKKRGLGEIIEDIEEKDKRWWSDEKVSKHLAMMDKSHYERVIQLAQNDQYAYRTFYRRRRNGMQRAEVRNDELAGCLRTAVGGSGKQFVIKAGFGRVQMRTMTPREYARLQGVPDRYPINVNGVQALTGFGDAVCVPVITWIGKNVLNRLVENHFSEDAVVVRIYGR
ncbi:MAG: DNA (cytosine-5-)-methyltransferase [Anaerolineaceae bacterium]|nr:DNA (cytosine-5-)-methyltransferase [Anaerolineaceae bacterium]